MIRKLYTKSTDTCTIILNYRRLYTGKLTKKKKRHACVIIYANYIHSEYFSNYNPIEFEIDFLTNELSMACYVNISALMTCHIWEI